MVRFEGISKSYQTLRALENVSFEVVPGKINIIAGADGAGKSTLFKILLGLVKKEKGTIYLKGVDILDQYSRISAISGYMPERFSLYLDLSIEENMNFFADIHQVPRIKRESMKKRLLEKTGLIQFKNRRAGDLSGGMKQKLALSTILLTAPELIILDEPTTGVDPLSRIEFFTIIDELKSEGKTIVISTPYLDEAEQGDYIVFIKSGRIIQQGSIDELRNNFPAKLVRILPEGNIFDVLNDLNGMPDIARNLYIRGRYLKYLQEDEVSIGNYMQIKTMEVEEPSLEDIYLYYERKNG